MTIYRILQEALNLAKHAQASELGAEIRYAAGLLRCQSCDDSVGFPSSAERSGGLGLTSIRERAAALGGTLQLSRSDSGGALLRVELPFDSHRSEERAP